MRHLVLWLAGLLLIVACQSNKETKDEVVGEETLDIPECVVTTPPDSLGAPIVRPIRRSIFAEAVQDWFNVNAEMPHPDDKHNWCNTREELQEFDPDLYNLLAEYFPQTNLQISKHKKINEYGHQ